MSVIVASSLFNNLVEQVISIYAVQGIQVSLSLELLHNTTIQLRIGKANLNKNSWEQFQMSAKKVEGNGKPFVVATFLEVFTLHYYTPSTVRWARVGICKQLI